MRQVGTFKRHSFQARGEFLLHDVSRLRSKASSPCSCSSRWTESSKAAGPRLGGRAWEKKNDQLEKELERMSDSVNVMFKDQVASSVRAV